MMDSLVIRAVVNGLEFRSELDCRRAFLVCFEGLLILPCLNDRVAVRPSDLLNHFDTKVSILGAAGLAILLYQLSALARRTGLHVDVRSDIERFHHHDQCHEHKATAPASFSIYFARPLNP